MIGHLLDEALALRLAFAEQAQQTISKHSPEYDPRVIAAGLRYETAADLLPPDPSIAARVRRIHA